MKNFHLPVDENFSSTGRWKFFICFVRWIKSSLQGMFLSCLYASKKDKYQVCQVWERLRLWVSESLMVYQRWITSSNNYIYLTTSGIAIFSFRGQSVNMRWTWYRLICEHWTALHQRRAASWFPEIFCNIKYNQVPSTEQLSIISYVSNREEGNSRGNPNF